MCNRRITHLHKLAVWSVSKVAILAILVLAALHLHPLQFAHAQGSGNWRVLTEEDGLASNRVQAIADAPPDADGVPGLWFGTDQGLSYFNGREWLTFAPESPEQQAAVSVPLPDTSILSLLVTPDGALWIGTARGLVRLDSRGMPRRGKAAADPEAWRTLTTSSVFPLPNDRVQALAFADESLWVGTADGAARFDYNMQSNEILYAHLPDGDVRDIAVARNGAVWFATAGGAVKFDGQNWKTWSTENSDLASDNVRVLAEDAEGTMWFATDEGVSRLISNGEWLEPLRAGDGLATLAVNDLATDAEGRVWLATDQGLSRWDSHNWRRFFQLRDDIPSDKVLTVQPTIDGTVWVGTDAGAAGLDGTWEGFDPGTTTARDELGANVVRAFWGDGETLWAGTAGGVSRSTDRGQTWQTATTADGLGGNNILSLWGDGQTLWAGAGDGGGISLSQDGGRTWQAFAIDDGYWDNVVQALWGDGKTLWAGTAGGVGRSDDGGRTWQVADTRDGLASENVFSLWGDGQTLWAGTKGGVVNHSDDGGQTWHAFALPSSAQDDLVWELWGDEQALWAISRSGLSRSDDGGEDWISVTTKDGLAEGTVQALWGEGEALWVATLKGISHSSDLGQTWQTFAVPTDRDWWNVQALWGDGNSLWIGTYADGVVRSPDGGQTWEATASNEGMGFTYIDTLWADGDSIWVGKYGAGISHSSDGGQTWQTFVSEVDLRAVNVTDIWMQEDTVWIATDCCGVSRSSDTLAGTDSNWTWRRSTTADGLGSDNVLALWGDNQSLWAGTDGGGLSRSTDGGQTWETLRPGDYMGSSIVQTLWGDGQTLWAGTPGGLSRSDDGGQTWETFTNIDGIDDPDVRALWGEGEAIWIITYQGGLSRSNDNGQTWQTFTTPGDVASDAFTALSGNSEAVWVGVEDRDVVRSSDNGQTWEVLTRDDDLASDWVHTLWSDGESMWVGTENGLNRYRPQGAAPWARLETILPASVQCGPSEEPGKITQPMDCPPAQGEAIKLLDSQDLTVQFVGGSLTAPLDDLRYEFQLEGRDQEGDSVILGPGLGSLDYTGLNYGDYIFHLEVIDKELRSAGVQNWPVLVQASPVLQINQVVINKTFTQTVASRLAGNRIQALWGDGQAVWAGTEYGGVSRTIDGGQTWETFTTADGLGDNYVSAVWSDGQTVWVGAYGGGVSYSDDDGQTWQTTTKDTGLGSNLVESIWGSDEAVWVGTDGGGISRTTDGGQTWETFSTDEGLQDSSVQAVWGDGQTVWVGTKGGGVSRSSDGGQTWQTSTVADGLGDNVVRALWGDGQTLWASTRDGGVSRSDDGGQTWQTFTREHGLRSNWLFALWGDESTIWVGTSLGLSSSTDGGETWTTFTMGIGQDNDEIMALWGDGQTIWAGTEGGGINHSIDGGESWEIIEGLKTVALSSDKWKKGFEIALALNIDDQDTPAGSMSYEYAIEMPNGSLQPIEAAPDNPTLLTIPKPDDAGIYRLFVTAVDDDGNRSDTEVVRGELDPPKGLPPMLYALLGAAIAVLLYPLVVYGLLARPYGVPLQVMVSPRQLARFVGHGPRGYPEYKETFGALDPLGKFLVLTLPLKKAFDLRKTRETLRDQAVPVEAEAVKAALATLARRGILQDRADGARFASPDFAQIHRQAVSAEQVEDLAQQVRRQNPVYSTALRFFQAAGFDLDELAPAEFLLTPKSARYRERFGQIYTRIAADGALRADDVRDVRRAAGEAYGGNVEDRIAFVVVDRTPEAGARFQIYALRADAHFTIIPLSRSLLLQALLDDRSAEALDSQIRLYLGETDLYAVSTPVTDVLSFFGRGRIIDEVMAQFDQRQHVGLFGLRKMGKTSLLWQLRERMRHQAVAFLDLQAVARDTAPLYGQIVQEWVKDIRFRHPGLELPELSTTEAAESSDVETFRRDLLSLRDALGQREPDPRLVLFLDEVERMLPSPGGERPGFRNYEEFLAVLRGIAQQHGCLTMLVAGVDPRLNRTDRWGNVDNPMYRFFQGLFLPPFEKAECKEMVTNIGRQMGLTYTPKALDQIYREGGGHPFLTRDLCSGIVRGLPRPATIGSKAVDAGLEFYLTQPSSYLDSLWEQRLDEQEQDLLIRLAQEGSLSMEALLDGATDRRAAIQSLGTLTERYLLARSDGKYRLAFTLFQRWIRFQMLGTDLHEALSDE